MASWKGSQFGKPGANINGTDFKRTLTNESGLAKGGSTNDSPAISGMANSLSTQAGQVNMGNSRSTSGGTGSGNTYESNK